MDVCVCGVVLVASGGVEAVRASYTSPVRASYSSARSPLPSPTCQDREQARRHTVSLCKLAATPISAKRSPVHSYLHVRCHGSEGLAVKRRVGALRVDTELSPGWCCTVFTPDPFCELPSPGVNVNVNVNVNMLKFLTPFVHTHSMQQWRCTPTHP